MIKSELPRTRFKVGTFTRDLTLAAGFQQITDTGFKPESILLLAAVNGTQMMSLGALDSTLYRASLYDDSPNAANTYQISLNTYVIILRQTVGGTDQSLGRVTALNNDGFTMEWLKNGNPVGTATIFYLAIG